MAGKSRAVAPSGQASIEASGSVLDRNLASMGVVSQRAARAIAQAQSRTDLEWTVADDGLISCAMTDGWGRKTAFASRKRPGEEARRLAETVDIDKAGVIVVKGFGCGHHVRALLERGKSASLIVVYEPDVALLRSVLERQDFSGWLVDPLVAFITDPDDAAAISETLTGSEGLVSLGVKLVEHPPSSKRLADTADRFEARLAGVVRAIRTNVITTLVQSDVTMRNQIMNLDRYAEAPGIDDLKGSCAGRPAIVVSAGPSLRRNLHLLEQPWVREKFVIIAVQTVLRPMLARGIKPHFVTALDYHEISRRFYEGLTKEDVEGVTLVAEAKGNPAILDAWPGELRCPKDNCLSKLLEQTDADRGPIKPGATVAHLAYYLARHLGCDPVTLIGQDLAFTDGQYYASGAAIHDVWASELGEFCTLETLEWQRIARMRSRLVPARDHLGRGVYTDEQMHTYLTQFERDFAADANFGLTVIDATEGGIEKQGVRVMTLAEVLEQYKDSPDIELPATPEPTASEVRAAKQKLRDVRADVWKVGELCRKSHAMMMEMAEHHQDQGRVNELIKNVYAQRDEVVKLEPAFSLVQDLNQTGTLKRAKADRKIHLADQSALEQQKAQIERDAENVRWLGDAADLLGEMMDAAIRAHDGKAPKITREDPAVDPEAEENTTKQRVWAVIPADPWKSDLGVPRDLSEPVIDGKSALRLTLERLAQTKDIEGVAIVTHNVGDTAKAAGLDPSGGRVGRLAVQFIEADAETYRARAAGIRGARAFSARSWRGGVAGWTAYDEIFHPNATLEALDAVGADAALLVGADWGFIDPALCDEAASRFKKFPRSHRLVFSQAAVGLSPLLIEKSIVKSITQKKAEAGSFASIGSMLGYLPVQPSSDPIAGTGCIHVPPIVRDLGERVTLDSCTRRELVSRAIRDCDALKLSAEGIAKAISKATYTPSAPEHLTLELVAVNGTTLDTEHAITLIRQATQLREDVALTLTAETTSQDMADVLDHPELVRIVGAAKGAGVIAVHVRTPALAGEAKLIGLAELGVDVISVDYVSDRESTCELLTGRLGFGAAHEALTSLIHHRNTLDRLDDLHMPWVVVRLTRRDAIYEEIEPLYDRWMMACGAAVIDPLPEAVPGERIEPFELPQLAMRVLSRSKMTVRADRTTDKGDHARDGIAAAWRRQMESLTAIEPAQVMEIKSNTQAARSA
ncbi:MAG: motility associated factor glycosyltransferase family protein [Phycisphaerales bacterium]|nr:motility associated factor glycosyltransferase family protein [Phycisphaerales bacterium]